MEGDWDAVWNRWYWQHEFLYKCWHRFLWHAYQRLLQCVELAPHSRVLELGSGSGRISLMIAATYHCSVTLVDISKGAISSAEAAFRERGIPGNFICSDVFDIGMRNEFDLVHSEGLIEHFNHERSLALLKIHREALHSKGHIITFAPVPTVSYAVTSWLLKATGNWPFGWEVTMSLGEHIALYEDASVKVVRHTSVLQRELGLLGQVKML